MVLAHLELQAISDEHKIARYYIIELMTDLFNDLVIVVYFGAKGYRGRMRQYSYPTIEDIYKRLYAMLKKRFQAQNRIGCNYELIFFYAN